jgi:hypothetical protein
MRRGTLIHPDPEPRSRPDWFARLFVLCLIVFLLSLVTIGWGLSQ